MYLPVLLTLLLSISSITLTAPVQSIEERHILTETLILARQQQPQNIPQLLTLASLAGITLPTDPAVLISLAPVAAELQSYLPTSSVLSVLQTAAPPEFLSNVVHDPAYAASFQSAFAAGSSPSWFLALPTDVKDYLHTYSNYGGVATAVDDLGSVAGGRMSSRGSEETMTSGGSEGTATSMGDETSQTTSVTSRGDAMTSGNGANAQETRSSPSTTAATGGAVRPTGPLVLALAGVVGVLALAVTL
ncbi:MAG: hypothetical protein LQ343_007520 [Gyalolechia ehrenbergii]|nr:MAG: hypothetical protein LQ343_007520 [Gyalolechia ehrenbergii]